MNLVKSNIKLFPSMVSRRMASSAKTPKYNLGTYIMAQGFDEKYIRTLSKQVGNLPDLSIYRDIPSNIDQVYLKTELDRLEYENILKLSSFSNNHTYTLSNALCLAHNHIDLIHYYFNEYQRIQLEAMMHELDKIAQDKKDRYIWINVVGNRNIFLAFFSYKYAGSDTIDYGYLVYRFMLC